MVVTQIRICSSWKNPNIAPPHNKKTVKRLGDGATIQFAVAFFLMYGTSRNRRNQLEFKFCASESDQRVPGSLLFGLEKVPTLGL
jgi:hypothetical protein